MSQCSSIKWEIFTLRPTSPCFVLSLLRWGKWPLILHSTSAATSLFWNPTLPSCGSNKWSLYVTSESCVPLLYSAVNHHDHWEWSVWLNATNIPLPPVDVLLLPAFETFKAHSEVSRWMWWMSGLCALPEENHVFVMSCCLVPSSTVYSVGVIAAAIFLILLLMGLVIAVTVVCYKRREAAQHSGKEGMPLQDV